MNQELNECRKDLKSAGDELERMAQQQQAQSMESIREIEKWKQRCASVSEEKNVLASKMSGLERGLSDLQHATEVQENFLRSENERLKLELRKVRNESASKLEAQKKDLLEWKSKLGDAEMRMKQHRDSQNEEMAKFRDQLESEKLLISELRKVKNAAESQLEAQKKDILQWKSKFGDAEIQMKQHQDSQKEEMARVQNQLENEKLQVSELRRVGNESASQIEAQKKDILQWKSKFGDAEMQLKQFQYSQKEEMAKVQNQLENEKLQLSESVSVIYEWKEAFESVDQKCLKIEKELQSTRQSSSKELAQLDQDLRDAHSKELDIQMEIQESLRKAYGTSSKELGIQMEIHSSLREAYDACSKELAIQMEIQSALREGYQAREKQVAELVNKISDYEENTSTISRWYRSVFQSLSKL